MEQVLYSLKVLGVLAVAVTPILLFLQFSDRRHERIWRQFAGERGAVLKETARGLGRFWEPGGPRQLEIRLDGTIVTVRFLSRLSFSKASTTADGLPRFLVRPVRAISVRGWGPKKEVGRVTVGDPQFEKEYEVRCEEGCDTEWLVDEEVRSAHRRAPNIVIGTDKDGCLAAKLPGWGRDSSELHRMIELIELYLKKQSLAGPNRVRR